MDADTKEVLIGKPKMSLSLKAIAEKVSNYFAFKKSTPFSINDVAASLNVPKRRIYDVLNIMQPLGIVTRAGRGKYVWSGSMNLNFDKTVPDESSDRSHVKDLSLKLLEYIKNNDKNVISMSEICESVFDGKKGQLRRLYDISAVFEVLNLVKKQQRTSEFLVLPQLKNLFISNTLPPKKRWTSISIVDQTKKQNLVSPAPTLAELQQANIKKSSTWLEATTLHL